MPELYSVKHFSVGYLQQEITVLQTYQEHQRLFLHLNSYQRIRIQLLAVHIFVHTGESSLLLSSLAINFLEQVGSQFIE